MVVSYKLIASNRTREAITSDAEMALSIARVARALQFQGDFTLLRQFNFGMASLERVVCHCLMLLTKVRSKAMRKPCTRRSLEEATQLLRYQYERTRTATAMVADAYLT